ncbi:MAG: DNA mismatch endonuclease Vsr [Hydrogenophilales bacterium]|nr:DNA mismatch endonuclease Vsr [Hydrogenophilales bacterium]
MADIVDQATRSRMMAGICGRNTQPELFIRKYLHRHGLRYRLHARDLPGSPDIVLPKWKVVILVHGCFWHRHNGCRFNSTPATNPKKWLRKFEDNVLRDRRNVDELVNSGWRIVILWECGVKDAKRGKESMDWLITYIQQVGSGLNILEWPVIDSEPAISSVSFALGAACGSERARRRAGEGR